ncbi:MAG: hypothetical protein JSU70_08220 [Phycisphaerales bacterium]|nr:MAG: hypothetical protein JSU70_08220 [Phycisphaerales bacterium]
MYTHKHRSLAIIVIIVIATLLGAANPIGARDQSGTAARRVMAFYYPWYGVPNGPGGAGRTVHWGRIDVANKDIAASTHYPSLGAYDSHDPKLIDQHCRWAKDAHIDTLIVSWWGHNSYSDRAMDKILEACGKHNLNACIYYETVPRPQTAQSAARDIVRVLNKYGSHSAHLKINGKPVVFVYGRTLQELGLLEWREAAKIINSDYGPGATLVGDQFSYGSARVFDGLHTYNTAGSLQGMDPPEARKWASDTYQSWVQLADKAGKISTVTVIPGYDDTKIRKPGLAVERYGGGLYRVQWEEAIKADPHWVLITSFNEWHEGSEIEPSHTDGRKYLALTAEYARSFKASPRAVHPITASTSGVLSEKDKAQLRERLNSLQIAVLPGADSMAFWWLLDIGVDVELLTWEQVVGGELSAKRYPVLLYCAGEHYRRSVRESGDVDKTLKDYLKAGGCIMALPSLPWPFYYDEDGLAVNRSKEFGLTLRMGWENPPKGEELHFVQPERRLRHVPERFVFPPSGDLRWRGFFAGDDTKHLSLLQLRDGENNYLGDGVTYTELAGAGRVVYAWFGLLNSPHAEPLLYDLFDFVSRKLSN